MKKSCNVPATLIAALAAGLTSPGCGSDRECRDAKGTLLPDSACRSGTAGSRWVPRTSTGGFGKSDFTPVGS